MLSYVSLEGLIVFAVILLQISYGYNENDPAVGTKEQRARNCLTVWFVKWLSCERNEINITDNIDLSAKEAYSLRIFEHCDHGLNPVYKSFFFFALFILWR